MTAGGPPHDETLVDATAAGTQTTIRGAQAVAANARAFSANTRFAEPALVDGAVDIDADPAHLNGLSLAVLD